MKPSLKIISVLLLLLNLNAYSQQYWHRVKGGLGDIGTGEATFGFLNDPINNVLYACGSFKSADDTISCSGIAYWNGDIWNTNIPYPPNGSGLPFVSSLSLYNGLIYGTSGNIFHYDGTDWVLNGELNGLGYCLCVYHNKLYVGGDFTNVDGIQATFIACYDGANWSEPGGGIWCTQFPGDVSTMCVWNDKLIVGGNFDQAGGVSVHSVAAWNDTAWSDVGGGVVNINAPTVVASVNALCVHDSDLIVGGYLTHGGFVPANNICGFDGNNWFALGGGITGGDVFSLLSWDSTLYIGGNFAFCGGLLNTNWIGKWDGNNYHPVGDSLQGIIYTMCIYDSVLYAGGYIPLINSHSVNNIARLLDYPDTTNYNDTTSIGKLIVADKQLIIYPNPTTEKITIETNESIHALQVSNVLGEIIFSQNYSTPKTEVKINVTELPLGIYFLKIQTIDGWVVRKFVKQ